MLEYHCRSDLGILCYHHLDSPIYDGQELGIIHLRHRHLGFLELSYSISHVTISERLARPVPFVVSANSRGFHSSVRHIDFLGMMNYRLLRVW